MFNFYLYLCCDKRSSLIKLNLSSYTQIKWQNRHNGDIGNNCLACVDGTDCPVPWLGRKFKTPKFKFCGGLRYELCTSIIKGDLCWLNEPFEPGIWHDVSIARSALLSHLNKGEQFAGAMKQSTKG